MRVLTQCVRACGADCLRAKLEEAISRLDVGIDQAAQKMQEDEDDDFDADEHYEDDMDYAERFDPHDR